jgi:beta-phosphoglucomutase-like phosphatase (HAD superfamily)
MQGTMNSLPDLVIFDCDGVLVDSEIIAIGVLAECLNEAGVLLNVEQTMAYGVGKGAAAVATAIKTDFGIALPANFFEDMGARIIAAYPGKLRPMNGIPELLAALNLRRCVASNSPIDRVRQALTTTGLMPYLEPHLYSAAMVARGKPAPDLFLHAAEQQGVQPERCLVIEDSLSGVAAALAAGMPVIGFIGGGHCRPGHADAMHDAGCVEVFSRMDDVAKFLGR